MCSGISFCFSGCIFCTFLIFGVYILQGSLEVATKRWCEWGSNERSLYSVFKIYFSFYLLKILYPQLTENTFDWLISLHPQVTEKFLVANMSVSYSNTLLTLGRDRLNS